MSLTPEQRRTIIQVRLDHADEAHRDALLLSAHGSMGGTANRIYYAVFHALSAIAIDQGKAFKTHRGLIAFFYAECIQTKAFEAKWGRVVQRAFEERSHADYEDDVIFDGEEQKAMLSDVAELLALVRKTLSAPD